jgi:hypothetical protein
VEVLNFELKQILNSI